MASDQPIGAFPRLASPDDRKPSRRRPADPCAKALFDATGDLVWRLAASAGCDTSRAGERLETDALIAVGCSDDALEGFVRDTAALTDQACDETGKPGRGRRVAPWNCDRIARAPRVFAPAEA